MDLSITGLASGFDWSSLVDQLAEAERAPQKVLTNQQTTIKQQNSAYNTLQSQLELMQTAVDALSDSDLYDGRTANSSNTGVATATAQSGATKGTYSFNITQLATNATLNGTSGVGGALGTAATTLADAGFSTAVTTGNFTINGKAVTISSTSQTLQDVFDAIKTATTDSAGNYVEASYDSDTDKITLTAKMSDGSDSSTPIVIGAKTDTSNFLTLAKLSYNGSGQVTSSSSLGAVNVASNLDQANFATAITGGATGQFKVNGVAINYDASSDSVADVISRINASDAGVTASYDSVNNRFRLTNNETGDNGIAMEDVSGNFLAATGLLSGTLNRGQNLQYTINGGGQISSTTNQIDANTSGIEGLSVNVLAEGSSTITVGADTDTVKKTINNFITAYNKSQSIIDTYTASTTGSDGKVTAGVLSSRRDVGDIAANLRANAFNVVAGLSGTINSLASIGISTSGYDNSLTLSDSDALDNALNNNLSAVKSLFTNDTTGVASRLSAYIKKTAGDGGSIATTEASLTKQSENIDKQIESMERTVQSSISRMKSAFQAMEEAQAKINQQSSYLKAKFGS